MSSLQQLVRSAVPRSVRNWIRAPHKSIRWIVDDLRFKAGWKQQIAMREGWSLVCHPAAYRCSYGAQQRDPEQIAEFDSFIRHCSPGMQFVDIGAHFGLFSLAALHYGGVAAHAVAVDPSPIAARMMRIHSRLNGVAARMEIVEACVSDRPGVESMVAVGVLADGYFTAPGNHSGAELSKVNALTLDQLASRLPGPVTHVKIDVEGHELAVLRGASDSLARSDAPRLFIELHNGIMRGRGIDPGECVDLLMRCGFETRSLSDAPLSRNELLAADLVRLTAVKKAN